MSGTKRARIVVGEPDPPGRGRGGLLAGQQPVAQPAADGEQRDAELGGGLVDRHELASRGPVAGRRGCRRAGGRRGRGAAVNGRPVPVRRPLRDEDRGDLVVGVMLRRGGGSARSVSSGSRRRSGPRALRRTLSSVRAPPSQQISTSARSSAAWTVTMTSLTSVRSSSLRSRSVVVGAFHSRGRSRASRASAARSSSVSGAGRACSSAASLPRSRSTRGERVLERAFEGAGDEPVLGLAGVELAARAVGLELGALDARGAGRRAARRAGHAARATAPAVAATPAGVTASRNAAATALSRRPPPSDWQVWSVACSTWPRRHA